MRQVGVAMLSTCAATGGWNGEEGWDGEEENVEECTEVEQRSRRGGGGGLTFRGDKDSRGV